MQEWLEHPQPLGTGDACGPRRRPGSQAQAAHGPARPHDSSRRAGPRQASDKRAGLRGVQRVQGHHCGGEHLRLREALEPAQGQRHLLLRDLLVQGRGRQPLLTHAQVQGFPLSQRRQDGAQRLVHVHVGHADRTVSGVQGRGLHVEPGVHAAAHAKRLEAQALGRVGHDRVEHPDAGESTAWSNDHAGRHVEAGARHACDREQASGHHLGALHKSREEIGARGFPLGGGPSRGRQRKSRIFVQARGDTVAVGQLVVHVAPSRHCGARLTQGPHVWSRLRAHPRSQHARNDATHFT